MKLESPRIFDGDLMAAYESAIAQCEPVFVPATIFADDRGWSIMNQFQSILNPEGQINYSVVYPGVVKAWHRHERQSDLWMGLMGNLKVGIHRDDGSRSWLAVIGEKAPGVMVIPPPLWHGMATVGHTPCGLLYYVTVRYDVSNPDEQRLPFDGVEGFPWQVRHG